jgi:hypothetical protein
MNKKTISLFIQSFFHPENVFSLFSAILFLFSAFVCGGEAKNEITSEALHHAPSLNQAVHK